MKQHLKPGYTDNVVRSLKTLIPMALLFTAACSDPFGPAVWNATPDTIRIFSASRAEYLGFASAVDVASSPILTLPLEVPGVTGGWDFTVLDSAGGLALAPAPAFQGLDSRARVAELVNRSFDSVTQAPADTTQYKAVPVMLELGNVYVIRSRRSSCGLSSGQRYAKLKPVAIDVAGGTFTFEIVRNPYCDDRSFIPPEA